jgi:iron complex outermembrane receptor protein
MKISYHQNYLSLYAVLFLNFILKNSYKHKNKSYFCKGMVKIFLLHIYLLGCRTICWGLGLMGIFFSLLFSQNDTTQKIFNLPEVSIIEEKWESTQIGHEVSPLDSIKKQIFANQRITDWLQMEGFFYVKNYGLGQLNTLSYRGSTANQNQILWNGVPLQSPFNATPDYAQIPVTSMNVSMLRGSNPALWGSGAGASLLLTPCWNHPYKVSFLQQIGSFGLNQQALFLQKKFKKHSFLFQTYRLFARNNFPFTNREKMNAPKEILSHAKTLNYGIQLDYKTYFSNSNMEFHLWKHHSQIQIPPVMTADTSAQNQKDDNLRMQWMYQIILKNLKFTVQQSFLRDYLWYEDSIAQIFSGYTSNQWFSDNFLQFSKKQNHFQFQLQNHLIFPYAKNSMVLPKLWQRHSLISSYFLIVQKWKLGLTYRQEYVQNQWVIPIGNMVLQWNFYRWFYVKSSIGNSFRYPSLNDLYWKVGGNPNLKPEKGFLFEGTLGYQNQNSIFQITYYQNAYQNLIVWLANGSFWSAQNLSQVRSNGIEFQVKLTKKFKNHQILGELSGYYGKSILTKARFENDEAYQKQLIYQPKYRWHFQISWLFHSFSFTYQHLWNGYVYYATDNSAWLPDFYLGNCILNYTKNYKKHEFSVNFQVKNLWDVEYQVIKNRAMPGRNYLLGLGWKFD